MFQGLSDVLQVLVGALPPWLLGPLAVLTALVAGPAWFDNVRIKQIRGRIRKRLRATPDARERWEEESLALAGDRPARLVALVREAHKYLLKGLRDRALERLRRGGRAPEDVRSLDKLIATSADKPRDPLEALVRVDALMEQGLWVAAREQLDVALARFPEHAELRDAERRLNASAVPEGARVG